MRHEFYEHMFRVPLPILEKLLRPAIVYLFLVILLRLFGKRELAQLNPFDLVVLLCLSNTVQNAMIGDDNSISGGLLGAFGLLAVNWVVVHTIHRSDRLTRLVTGRSTVLIRDGNIDPKALQHESLSHEELTEVIHRNGFETFHQIRRCELEPNGTFYIEAMDPSPVEHHLSEIMAKLELLNREVVALRAQGDAG
jgi:uncharacterized membrane protein YcaP (DUF421 family)